MKKACLFLMFLLVCCSVVLATDTSDETNFYIDEVDELVFDENYDYSNSYDENEKEENNSETRRISMKGIVVEAGEPYEYTDEFTIVPVIVQDLKVKIIDKESGKYYQSILPIRQQLTDDYDMNIKQAYALSEGDRVYVTASHYDDVDIDVSSLAIEYFDKTNIIIKIIVIYAIAIILIGGLNGIKALVGLIVTVVAIFTIMIPAIFNGANAMLVTILVSLLVTCITFFVVSGFKKKTWAAIIGTICGILTASLFACMVGNIMNLTGINEDSRKIMTLENKNMFDFRNLMFAGIVIGALGACMDVGMSIASALSEMKEEIPDISVKRLIKAGMNIGKDVMGTMTNTLILAYVGSSMTSILLFMGFDFEMYDILNQEMIAEEILRAIAGSMGLVCTIPLTAIVSAFIMGKKD